MNYQKWPAQSVLWLTGSVSLLVIYVGFDLYKWEVRGKPFSLGKLFNDCVFSVVIGWTATLSSQAKGVAFLTWVAAAVLTLIGGFEWEKTVHLSPLVDAACDQFSVLLPVLVAVGAALLWRRRERMQEKQTVS